MNSNQAEVALADDRLRFHDRCGSLIRLSVDKRTAERRRPLDEFNNGVVMTNRPLRDDEMFEVCLFIHNVCITTYTLYMFTLC